MNTCQVCAVALEHREHRLAVWRAVRDRSSPHGAHFEASSTVAALVLCVDCADALEQSIRDALFHESAGAVA